MRSIEGAAVRAVVLLALAAGCRADPSGTVGGVKTSRDGGFAADGSSGEVDPGVPVKPNAIPDDGVCDPARKKSIGGACDCAAECASGFCADGICCNTACNGACVSCALPNQKGECAPVGLNVMDPHNVCKAEAPETCGHTGLCNGAGGCAKAAPGAICSPASCAAGAMTPASTCNGNGTCVIGSPINCAPSTCQGDACMLNCKSDADCVAPNSCVNGSCGMRGLGQKCSAASQCKSGFCADGVCCESACTGTCTFCAMPSSLGRCVPVGADVPDPRVAAGGSDPRQVCLDQGPASCGNNGRCNGAGACQKYANGTACRGQTCNPQSNEWTAGGVCLGGACAVPEARPCTPYACNGNRCGSSCTTNLECSTQNVCADGSCGRQPIGGLCGHDADCASNFCAQGVCCNTRCDGSCQACNLPGLAGTCSAVPEGGQDPAGMCHDQGPASCGTDGTCNGAGACRKYGAATICAPQTCVGGLKTLASTCSGTGECIVGASVTCAPYTCSADATNCNGACAGEGPSPQCQAPNRCLGGKCGQAAKGQSCQDNSDCQAGLSCSSGVCCDRACGGSCESCTVSGSVGTCTAIGCVPGSAQTCGMGGTQSCSNACQWSSCMGQTCAGPASQACGTCGTQTRTCDNGVWSGWSACSNEGVCAPGSMKTCGTGGNQTCNAACQWDACGGQTCAGPATQACGNCGTQARTCNNGSWSAWSACSGEGACAPSATQACGAGGSRTCGASCQWGTCLGQPCAGPATQACGNCGTQARTCNNGVWSDWGACGGEGACAPGATQACGMGGMQTCGATCQWDACGGQPCAGPATQACGNCGTQARTCNNGTWSDWGACGGEGCAPGTTQACGMGGMQACTAACQWGACAGEMTMDADAGP
jgi:hypothetical protein